MQTETSTAKVILYWTIVTVPLAWGVYHTVINALKLFG
jgi:hypothetical protein